MGPFDKYIGLSRVSHNTWDMFKEEKKNSLKRLLSNYAETFSTIFYASQEWVMNKFIEIINLIF